MVAVSVDMDEKRVTLTPSDRRRPLVPAQGWFGQAGYGVLPGSMETTIGSVARASSGMRRGECASILSQQALYMAYTSSTTIQGITLIVNGD